MFEKRGFEFLPLQTPWVMERLGLQPGAPLEEMRLLTRAGRDLGGADAVFYLARQIWWLWPLYIIGSLPGAHRLADRGYRWIAAHRGCSHIGCATRARESVEAPTVIPWTGLILLPTLALFAGSHVPAWAFMWLMVGALYFGFKWFTLARAMPRATRPTFARAFAYLFLWPGMDAGTFLNVRQRLRRPPETTGEERRPLMALFAVAKILIGLALLFLVARQANHALLAGWTGMIGLILIFHFGVFDLLAAFWRMAGIKAHPIMNVPVKSTSLIDFWGRRWNRAFNQIVIGTFFHSLVRSVGGVRATLTAFLISGLLHELVISFPAGAGYGLPTGYFLLQGWGIVAQRSLPGKRWGIHRGGRGWLFTMIITAAPAFFLFHPPFVTRLIVPFMQAIGAL